MYGRYTTTDTKESINMYTADSALDPPWENENEYQLLGWVITTNDDGDEDGCSLPVDT